MSVKNYFGGLVRTPNTQCVLCAKPLYRRPSDISMSRFVSCRSCHGEAMRRFGMTGAQARGLSSGRRKGTNNRTGYRHRAETRHKISSAHILYHMQNPNAAIQKGEKMRAENHYAWRGGSSKLNTSIRQMTENRKWMSLVKQRDKCCVRCGSTDKLEVHHIVHLSEIVAHLGIKSREEARRHAEILWDENNGETLCEPCHYEQHGRKKREVV